MLWIPTFAGMTGIEHRHSGPGSMKPVLDLIEDPG
jgi:hypothetical protein